MAAILAVYILSMMASIGHGLFDGSSSGYTAVPHSEISTDETQITLRDNKISYLGELEFSNYTRLRTLDLSFNKINSIHSSAFNGTVIQQLKVTVNKLSNFDFSAIGMTLISLHLGANLFTTFESSQGLENLRYIGLSGSKGFIVWPNLTHFGRNKFNGIHRFMFVNINIDRLLSTPISTWCEIEYISMSNNGLSNIPAFHCPPHGDTTVQSLLLGGNKLNSLSQFAGLADLDRSITTLEMDDNEFTTFPNLPLGIRSNLRQLDLSNNDIEFILEENLIGYKLNALNLGGNKLNSFPEHIFTIAGTLELQGMHYLLLHFIIQ